MRSPSVAPSQSGKLLATGDKSGTVKIWELTSGRRIKSWKAHGHSVKSVHWNADDQSIITFGLEKALTLNEFQNKFRELTKDKPITRRQYIELLSGLERRIKLWNLKSGKMVAKSRVGKSRGLNVVGFHPNHNELVSGCHYGDIVYWRPHNITDFAIFSNAHSGVVRDIAISSDGKLIVTVGTDSKLNMIDASSRKLLEIYDNQSVVTSFEHVAFNDASDKIVIIGKDKNDDEKFGHRIEVWKIDRE